MVFANPYPWKGNPTHVGSLKGIKGCAVGIITVFPYLPSEQSEGSPNWKRVMIFNRFFGLCPRILGSTFHPNTLSIS